MEEKEKSIYAEERELLHKQLKLLAEQSVGCTPMNLAALSEQMVFIYLALNPCGRRCSYTSRSLLPPAFSADEIAYCRVGRIRKPI